MRHKVAVLLVALALLAGCGTSSTSKSSSASTRATSTSAAASAPSTARSQTGGLPSGRPPSVRAQAQIGPAPGSVTAANAYGVWGTMTATRYQHDDRSNILAGTYYVDCVGWTTLLLTHAAPQATASLRERTGVKNPGRVPTPLRYAVFFRGLTERPAQGWRAVVRVSDVRAGDILAWQPETNNPDEKGHAVVAAGPAQKQADGTYALAVVDSTGTPHGPDDTRRTDPRNLPLPDGRPSGIGIGTIGIVVAAKTGAPVSIMWSLGTRGVPKTIGIGRPTS